MAFQPDIESLVAREELTRVFPNLKSGCQLVLVEPSDDNFKRLSLICSSISHRISSKLLSYILVPFSVHLSKSGDTSTRIIHYLKEILESTDVTDIEIFLHIYTLVFTQLQDKQSPEGVRVTSEELKLGVLRCISQLVKSTRVDVMRTFLTRNYYSKLSVGVFLCCQIAKEEKYLTLRTEALTCLMTLTCVSSESPLDTQIDKQLPDVLMLMVPGVSAACLSIIKSSDVQSHKPIVAALQLWSRLVAKVMSNTGEKPTVIKFSLQPSKIRNDDSSSNLFRLNNSRDFMNAMNKMKRDKAWLSMTDQQLAAVTKAMVYCQSHQNWKVRLALATAAYHLLDLGAENISQSVEYLAEALTFLSQDDDSTVSEFSKNCISKLGHKCEDKGDRRFVDIVGENLFSVLTRLPRILHGADYAAKEKELTVVSGFLEILGSRHLSAFLSSPHHLQRFLHSVIMAATPDTSSVSLTQEIAIRGFSMEQYSRDAKWRKLKLCDSQKYESSLKGLCSNLIRHSDIETFIHCLLDEFHSNATHKRNILLLFVHLFSPELGGARDSRRSLVKDVLTAIMEPSLWASPVLITQPFMPRERLQEDIVQMCLLGELVGRLAVVAGLEIFSPLLLNCLYQILELAGSTYTLIATAGQISLEMLASLYSDGKVSTLITHNVDYLSHHVMLKLRHAHRNPSVLSVLSVIMSHSSLDMISSLHEIIDDVLVQSCDQFQDINGSAFLQVFHSYLTCIHKWTVKPCVADSELPSRKLQQIADVKTLINELLEYDHLLTQANEVNEDHYKPGEPWGKDLSKDDQNGEYSSDYNENQSTKLPDHVLLTKSILNRSLHFLPPKNLPRQILVLEILKLGVDVLAEWPSEVLPMVHKIWSPFVQRLSNDNDPLLLQRAFSLLISLAHHTKDFIRARVAKEVLDGLCKMLSKSGEESRKGDWTQAYSMSQMYKLQSLLLSEFPKLAKNLQFTHKHVHMIVEAVTPYLSTRQPPKLQELCISMYKDLAKLYPDIVWAHLIPLRGTSEFTPPPDLPQLQCHRVEKSDSFGEDYISALEKVLTCI